MKVTFKQAGIAVIGVLVASIAVAQIVALPKVAAINSGDLFLDIPNGIPASTNVYASALQLQQWLLGGNSQRTGAVAPALTSCGTTPAIAGNDVAGTITMGTGTPTGCVITFNTAYVSTPTCSVDSQAQLTSFAYSVTNTAITTVQTGTSSNKVSYVCVAQAGG